MELLAGYDVIVDGSDNFATRYLINDACVLLGKPNVYGSVLRFEGQASVFSSGDGPCYRCLFREPPPPELVQNCADSGVLGVVPGLIGVIQSAETIKLITGIGDTLVGRLLLVDALHMRFRTIDLEKDVGCVACGRREITSLIDYEAFCGVGGLDTEPLERGADDEITPAALAARLERGEAPMLLDVREPYEWAITRLPEARLVPLNSLPDALDTLDRSAEIVVYCHHGLRSAAAVDWLREQGFARARNLVGGIDRWTLDVDPSMRRY
jgi:adenylyltransferase/sulfurtransferase